MTCRGELLLKLERTDVVKVDFCEAITLAQKMRGEGLGAPRDHEPRETVDKRGRRDEAHAMLAAIYNWFTEGFDTADLKDAKILFDQLAG